MRAQNPNSQKQFDYETDEYGYRMIDGQEEIIDKKSGKSNMDYWLPDKITDYKNHEHVFRITNMGFREVECESCRLQTHFNPAVNYREENGKAYIRLNHKEYEIVA